MAPPVRPARSLDTRRQAVRLRFERRAAAALLAVSRPWINFKSWCIICPLLHICPDQLALLPGFFLGDRKRAQVALLN